MAFKQVTKDDSLKAGDHFVTSTKGMRGYFAVEMWMNDEEADLGTFPEPWQSDPLSFDTEREADARAIELARELDLPYII